MELLQGQLAGNLYWQWVMKAGLWCGAISGAKPAVEMQTAWPKFDADKDEDENETRSRKRKFQKMS